LGLALVSEKEYRFFSMEFQDEQIASLLSKRDEAAFEQVFKTHYKNLHAYAFTILKDEDEAEEMVQQVFFKLWDRAEHLNFSGSVAAYLYRSVHNESLNYLKHQKVRFNHQMHVVHSMKNQADYSSGRMMTRELEDKFQAAMGDLPEQCRTIFQLSRFDEMKYREIADKLSISVKTVEAQMGKALKILRAKLIDFLPLLFLLFHL